MDGDGRDDEEEDQVDGYGGLVHGTAAAGEEDVLQDRHGEGEGVHSQCGADQDAAPGTGIVFFDLGEAVFGPGVGEVDEED